MVELIFVNSWSDLVGDNNPVSLPTIGDLDDLVDERDDPVDLDVLSDFLVFPRCDDCFDVCILFITIIKNVILYFFLFGSDIQ
jgi:hypothetical protein